VASFRLGRAPRFALRRAVIARREMRPNRLLPPNTFSTTSTRASWIPDYLVTRLSPRADRGTERFTTPNSLWRAVRLCFVRGRFLPQTFPSLRSGHEPTDRTSGTSVASPSLTEWRFRTHWSSSGPPRLHSPRVREDHTMSTTRDAFHRWVIASSGLTPSLVDLATLPPRSDSRHCFARAVADRFSTSFPVDNRLDNCAR